MIECLVIGDPIEHSLSPLMHNAGYAELNLQEEYVFKSERVAADELASKLHSYRTSGVRGVSVTMPHKAAVLPLLDSLDSTAEELGAVNTIVCNNDGLVGYNTDVVGVLEPLKNRANCAGKTAVVLGAGGAARAAVFALKLLDLEVIILNRTAAKAEILASEFDCAVGDLSDTSILKDSAVIVNMTSVGMFPKQSCSPVKEDVFQAGQIVLDAVYNPIETKFIVDAKARGAITVSGLEMFVTQGARQFELYTGHAAPIAAMEAALLRHFKERE